ALILNQITPPRGIPNDSVRAENALVGKKVAFYADHDTRISSVLYEDPFFKPAFSPELLRHVDFLAAGCAISPGWLGRQTKWPAVGLTDEILHAELRRLSPSEVVHIPLCLSHLPASAPRQLAPPGVTSVLPARSLEAVSEARITVIIPTAFRGAYLSTLLESLHRTTKAYRDLLDVVIITCDPPGNGEDALRNSPLSYRLLHHDHDFNYAVVNNVAARQSDSEILIFLNDDIEFHDQYWLPDMLGLLQLPRAGAVGALLLYPDETIQHAGCLIGMNGGVGHIGVGLPKDTSVGQGVVTAQREVSAVTGACMAIRREVFVTAGLFDENFPLSFNDVALCLALRDMGYTNYITTRSRITHHEARSRGYDDTSRKYQINREHFLHARTCYPGLREIDPYYNPNLELSQPYMGFAPLSHAQMTFAFRARTSGCLVLIAQRSDYDPTVFPVVDSLARAAAAGSIRVLVAGEHETRFSQRCRTVAPTNMVGSADLAAMRSALLDAHESTLILDLRLLEVMEGIPPSLPLLGLAVQDGKTFLVDLFGRRIAQHEARGHVSTDIADLIERAGYSSQEKA
ncbi:glycosyltransferase family 2 protein, partial [Acidomonas methanolica]|uniref:glycosyltransferase family 2 protein n=1 Tax=Acidomonas methanolica TaxID=437 RepID=UPI001C05632F